MPSEKENTIKLPSLDELFSSQEERDDAKLKRIHEIPLNQIDPFPDHPFKVRDDEEMENLIESIRAKGVITPCLVRQKKDGRYELIAGHRRKHACEVLGMDTLRCEIAELSKDEATILMVESNYQRTTILPSEKAFAYKMRLDAMKMLVSRMRENQKWGHNFGGEPVGPQLEKASEHLARAYGISGEEISNIGTPKSRQHDHNVADPVGPRYRSNVMLAKETGESTTQIKRYIRLTELIPELLELVDQKKIAMRPAVELSYLPQTLQEKLYDCIEMEQCTPSHAQAIRMRRMYEQGELTNESLYDIMTEQKPNQKERIILRSERIKGLFPKDLPVTKREEYVAAAMEYYGKHRKKMKERDAR